MQNCGKEALITMFKDSSLPFGIIRVELDETGRPADWSFLCCNQALETLTGRTRAELVSNSFLTLRPDGASEWMGPFYTAAFEKKPRKAGGTGRGAEISSVYRLPAHRRGRRVRPASAELLEGGHLSEKAGGADRLLPEYPQVHVLRRLASDVQ